MEIPIEMGIPGHLKCLLRPLCRSRSNRSRHGTRDWFKIGKGVGQDCTLSPSNLIYAEYIIRNAGLDVVKAGIKIARRNANNVRYADVTTLMAESKEEPKNFLMNVKEESEKVAL